MEINTKLENLLDEYIHGEISFSVYRQQRLQLVREFTNGYPMDTTIPRQIQGSQNLSQNNDQAAQFKVPTIPQEQNKSPFLTLVGLLVLIAFAVATWYSSQNPTQTDTQATPATPPKPAVTPVDETFIEDFLRADAWDTQSLSDFLMLWQQLPEAERRAARESQSFQRLKAKIKQQMQDILQQEKAGDKDVVRQEKLLLWFATELSIGVE